MAAKKEYGADSLQEMHFPYIIQHRPGMFIGAVDEAGAFRCLKEILDNSIDEAQAGHGDRIYIGINTETEVITIADRGRGVPMGKNKSGKFASEVVFATLHGSGKFDSEAYAGGVVGLNGVGSAAVNAMSNFLEVWSSNTGSRSKWATQRFEKGIKLSDPEPGEPPLKSVRAYGRGTVVRFQLSKKLFTNTRIDIERLHTEVSHLSMLNPGLEIVVSVDGEATAYKSDNGLIDMIYDEETVKSTLGKPFQLSIEKQLDLVLTWRDDANTETFSYVNSSYTPQEGTHVQGVRNAVLEVLKAEIPEKDREKLDTKFFLRGMRTALNWRMENPVYAAQTKDRLSNAEVVTQVKKLVREPFAEWVKKNAKFISVLVERARKFQKNEEKFQAENSAVKSLVLLDPSSRGVLPGKLEPADAGYSRDEKELILVEGDSAGGPCKREKMPWQEILPLRGKFLNAEKHNIGKLLANDEVRGIFTAMGIKPGDPYDVATRRVGRIGMLPDADPDGHHICALILALFSKHAKEWLTLGHVYYINAPLFIGRYNEEKHYANTLPELMAQFPENRRSKVMVTRLKGWSECPDTDLHDIALNPATRSVLRMVYTETDANTVHDVMGEDVDYRKKILGIRKAA